MIVDACEFFSKTYQFYNDIYSNQLTQTPPRDVVTIIIETRRQKIKILAA